MGTVTLFERTVSTLVEVRDSNLHVQADARQENCHEALGLRGGAVNLSERSARALVSMARTNGS